MPTIDVAYLGPEGTYAHEVALKRFRGKVARFVPCETIDEIFRFVSARRGRRGVAPIVNSSGGTIYETVDALMDRRTGAMIEEEIALNVKLALIGHKGRPIRTLYSHFVPFEHCDEWIRRKLPRVKRVRFTSTAVAAREAAANPDGAAIANKRAGAIYGLDILEYPIAGIPETNVTHFVVITRRPARLTGAAKTSLAVYLPNTPGALLHFLQPLAELGINLSTLISRPIKGQPRQYAFFVDIDGHVRSPLVRAALRAANPAADAMCVLGSYPAYRVYSS